MESCSRSHSHLYSYSTSTIRLQAERKPNSTENEKSNAYSKSMANTLDAQLDWNDRIGLQDRYSLEEKGWEVDVDWRSTPYGAGLFSKEDVSAGTILRKGVIGVNLKEFTSIADIEEFCTAQNENDSYGTGYRAKLEYVKDYLWGFNKDADDRGYDKTKTEIDDDDDDDQRFFGMWVPGNGLNHNEVPNTVYKPTPDGIDLVALVDIRANDELFDDYRRHGISSPWLKEFANIHNVTLNFADCNDFV
eukprot:jgi/Psemu1/208430/e_gw1.468.16.1